MSVVFGAQDPGDVFVLYSSVYVCVCVLKLHAGSYWVTAHGKTQKGGRMGHRGVGKGTGVNKKQKLEKNNWNMKGIFFKSEIYQFST